jgi:CRP/FNR family cyclic AMP-dependent transcriptional regulator
MHRANSMVSTYNSSNWIDQLPLELAQLTRQRMSQRTVVKGEIIYAEGQVSTALWQVHQGMVRVTNQAVDGKEVVFAIFAAQDCFGELSLIDGQAAANTATAMERGELAELSKADFDELYQQHPEFPQQINRLLCGRMRHMLNFYADVTLRPLEQRMASRICYLSDGHFGAIQAAELAFTQQDFASMLGASRQAVSKVLNQWREQGVIDLQYGKIRIVSFEHLQQISRAGD